MASQINDPDDLWDLEQYLTERRKDINRKYDPRGSRLKDAPQVYGAVVFTIYGPKKTDWLNRVRHIAVTNDVGGWEFIAQGQVQPFENTENYQRHKVKERFTPEMLKSYCEALGIRAFDPDFYGTECLRLRVKRATPGPTMSILEAQSHLYI
jgi:hypothetical protein